jgi:hypothetical protein
MILVVSDCTQDGHVAPVVSELTRRGHEVEVFDPAVFPGRSEVTLESTHRGVRATLRWEEHDLDLDRVESVWYRRPGDFVLSDRLLAEEEKWIRLECQHLFRAMWASTPGLWVSDPAAIRQSSLKVVQLGCAIDLGFEVPRFTVTNDVNRARRFIVACADGAVVKALAEPAIAYPNHLGFLYTHLITGHDLKLIDTVRFGPTFLQEYVPKRMDIRVTVIGSACFAVGIDSTQLRESRVDFRRAEVYDLPHRVLTLPQRVGTQCIDLVSRLGLMFGAIDLILAPDGRYLFLEINPNGQWYWLEEITGVPLTKTMCDLLAGTQRRP